MKKLRKNDVKSFTKEMTDFVTAWLKSFVKAVGGWLKKTVAKVGDRLLVKMSPVCKTAMLVTAGIAVLSGAVWLLGRKKVTAEAK